ncbi:MAG: type II toxin-antitoxin system death-on-curing family toxin [Oscillospiraceae bacterium]|nr:type II toxin-antitoxin system death-on-curing family toxin [Oscillospiraceae bacterium]
MIRLSKAQIISLHHDLIEATGGSDGILNEGLLESAINAPFQSFGDTEAYPSVQQKAARLGYSLVKNHAFADGNKRIGAHAMLVFLALNGIELEYTQEELSEIFLNLAADKSDFDDLLDWVITHQI